MKVRSSIFRRPGFQRGLPHSGRGVAIRPKIQFRSDYLLRAIAGVEKDILACDADIAKLAMQIKESRFGWGGSLEKTEQKLADEKSKMLRLVGQARGLYEIVITSTPIGQTNNLNPDKIPGFDFDKLPDKGSLFFRTYPNKKIAIANRGQYALHAYLSMKGKLEDHGFSFFVYATHEDIALMTPPLNLIPAENIIPIDDYKDIRGIVAKAKTRQIDAILPGYGFRSEDQEFPRLCETNGIGFIGPNAAAMTLAGDKIAFKNFMLKVGLPPIPGPMRNNQFITFKFDIQDPNLEIARDWIEQQFAQGYSVLIKATGAGGGKGIRKIRPGSDFYQNLAEAHKEAKSFVGKGEEPLFMLERDLTSAGAKPLHIELQVVSYRRENGEPLEDSDQKKILTYVRNCSLQNPHRQKMVEIAVPNQVPDDQAVTMVPQGVIDKMRATAARAAVAMNYGNAGTIEFLYDPKSGEYYTLEMNTRAQVEFLVQYLQEHFDGTLMMLGAFAGYTPQSMLRCSEHTKFSGVTGQVRVTGQPGVIHEVNYPKGEGIVPFTFLEQRADEPLQVSRNFDKQHGAILVQAPNTLCLLHKMRVAIEKMEIIGKGVDQLSDYAWDQADILRALDEAIALHSQLETPDIDTVRRLEASSTGFGNDHSVNVAVGGMLNLSPRIEGLFTLQKGMCLKPGEAVCETEAMKMQVILNHALQYGRVTAVYGKSGHVVNTGDALYDFEPIDEATFKADRRRRLESLRTEQLFTLAVSLVPVPDRAMSEIMRRAFAGERANHNIEWVEVDQAWQPPEGFVEISQGTHALNGLRIFEAQEEREEMLKNQPKARWYRPGFDLGGPMKKWVFVSPREWGLKDSVLRPYQADSSNAGTVPTDRLQLFSFIQTIAMHLLNGQNDLSLEVRNRVLAGLSQYENFLLGDSQDHYTPQEWVDHLVKSGKIAKYDLLPIRDRALFSARLTLNEAQGGYQVLMVAQKKVGADVNNGMNTELGFRDIVETLSRPENENLPVIFVANTIGADPARELDPSEIGPIGFYVPVEPGPDGLKRFFDTKKVPPTTRYRADNVNHGIADAVWAAVNHKAPMAAFIWNGASGGALPMFMGDEVFAMQHSSNAAVIGNRPAQILMNKELGNPQEAAEFHLQGPKGLREFGLVKEVLPEPASSQQWGLDGAAAFDVQFDRAIKLFNERFRWQDAGVRNSPATPANLYLARRHYYGNYGVRNGLLVETPFDFEKLSFREPSKEREFFLNWKIDSRQAFAKRALELLSILLRRQSHTGEQMRKILDLLDSAQNGNGNGNGSVPDFARILEKIRVMVDGMEGAAQIVREMKAIIHDKNPVRFSFQDIAENDFVCPSSGHVIRLIPPEFFLMGGLGNMVALHSFLPKNWVDVAPGGPLDTEVYHERLRADMRWLKEPDSPFVDPLAAWVVLDPHGHKFLFSMPSYFGGSHAQVTRKYSLLAQLAKEQQIPWIDIAFSGGMSMYHKLGALMGMSDMTINFSDLHRAIPEIQKQNPLMGHYRIIPNFPAYGGDSASSTARVSEESWRYISTPETIRESLVAGLGIIGNPEIGFAGPKVVTEPTVQAKMIALQKGQTWIDTHFAVGLKMRELMACNNLAEFVQRFRDAHDQAQKIYREKYQA